MSQKKSTCYNWSAMIPLPVFLQDETKTFDKFVYQRGENNHKPSMRQEDRTHTNEKKDQQQISLKMAKNNGSIDGNIQF